MSCLKNKKVLITYGPTWVPIDAVRVISNISSGTLGKFLVDAFVKAGARVTALEGPVAVPLKRRNVAVSKFTFYSDLRARMKKYLKKKFDIVVQAAAVSDYQLRRPDKGKLGSGKTNLMLELKPTEKIIPLIKKMNPGCFLVGFKLEPGLNKSNAKQKTGRLFLEAGCDLVVANSLTRNGYRGYILESSGSFLTGTRSRKDMARKIVQYVNKGYVQSR